MIKRTFYENKAEIFDEISGQNPELYAWDGVHPTVKGCAVIADALAEEVKKLLKGM